MVIEIKHSLQCSLCLITYFYAIVKSYPKSLAIQRWYSLAITCSFNKNLKFFWWIGTPLLNGEHHSHQFLLAHDLKMSWWEGTTDIWQRLLALHQNNSNKHLLNYKWFQEVWHPNMDVENIARLRLWKASSASKCHPKWPFLRSWVRGNTIEP